MAVTHEASETHTLVGVSREGVLHTAERALRVAGRRNEGGTGVRDWGNWREGGRGRGKERGGERD